MSPWQKKGLPYRFEVKNTINTGKNTFLQCKHYLSIISFIKLEKYNLTLLFALLTDYKKENLRTIPEEMIKSSSCYMCSVRRARTGTLVCESETKWLLFIPATSHYLLKCSLLILKTDLNTDHLII